MIRILEDGAQHFESLRSLLPVASRRLGPLPATKITNLYGTTVNWNLTGPAEERLAQDLAKCCLFFARIRFYVLIRSGWHDCSRHLFLCISDVLKAMLLSVVAGCRAITTLFLRKRASCLRERLPLIN
jgi:hypothetical protein